MKYDRSIRYRVTRVSSIGLTFGSIYYRAVFFKWVHFIIHYYFFFAWCNAEYFFEVTASSVTSLTIKNYEITLRKLFNNYEKTWRKLWKNLEKTMKKLWNNFEKTWKKLWENLEKTMKKLWENYEITWKKLWNNFEKTMK